jgi:hypothetical protein
MNKFKKIFDKKNNDDHNFFFKKLIKVVDYYWNKYSEIRSNSQDVFVKNTDEIKTEIDFSSLKIPKEITIKNAKEIAEYIVIPKNEKFPHSIEINNLGELSKYFEVFNKIDIPKEFSVKNLHEIPKTEFPENLKKLSLKKTEQVLSKVLEKLENQKDQDSVYIKNRKPEEYIPVRIVDKRGEDWLKDFGQTIVSAKSSVYLFDTDRKQINPATKDAQIDGSQKTQIVNGAGDSATDELSLYKTQALDDYTTASVTYVCQMKSDGTWLFMKIDESGNFATFTYANVSNNPTKKTYALAYTDRATLTYELLSELTI